jgi:hypothetical protein
MAWDDTDNQEYDEERDEDEEEEEDEYLDDDEDPRLDLPSTPYEEIYDMRPVEEVNGWIVLNEIINTKTDKLSLDDEKPNKKKSIKKESSVVFDFQNLDVPGDKNGAKEMR